MYTAFCDDCCGYLHTIKKGALLVAFSKDEAEEMARNHYDNNDGHDVWVAREDV